MKSKLILVLALGVATLFGCSKDDDSDSDGGSAAATNTDKITSGPWTLVAATADPPIDTGGPAPLTDVFNLIFDPCDQDDQITFNSDGTGVEDEGATKCDPADPQSESFTWEFLENETKVANDYGPSDRDTLNIVSLSSTEMKLSATESTGSTVHTITFTARHP